MIIWRALCIGFILFSSVALFSIDSNEPGTIVEKKLLKEFEDLNHYTIFTISYKADKIIPAGHINCSYESFLRMANEGRLNSFLSKHLVKNTSLLVLTEKIQGSEDVLDPLIKLNLKKIYAAGTFLQWQLLHYKTRPYIDDCNL